MVKVISISDEVYDMLSKVKGSRSFSQVIKDAMENKKKGNIKKFFGVLKGKSNPEKWKKEIYKMREEGWPEER